MQTLIFLCLITFCYAAYNLLVKVSSDHAGPVSAPPILATISLQLAALTLSCLYLLYLYQKGQSVFISLQAIPWAVAAGVCIGAAEIMYFILFRGFEGETVIAANRAIPFIVGGTIVITVVVAGLLLGEQLSGLQWLGVALCVAGMLVLGLSAGPANPADAG